MATVDEKIESFKMDLDRYIEDAKEQMNGLPIESLPVIYKNSEELSNLVDDINSRVQEEFADIDKGYDHYRQLDLDAQHKVDMGEMTQEDYEKMELDKFVPGVEEIGDRDNQSYEIVSGFMNEHPGLMNEDTIRVIYETKTDMDDEKISEVMAIDAAKVENQIYTTDRYMTVFSGSFALDNAMKAVEDIQNDWENSYTYDPDDPDFYSDDLASAQYEVDETINDFAKDFYVIEAASGNSELGDTYNKDEVSDYLRNSTGFSIRRTMDRDYLDKVSLAKQLDAFDAMLQAGKSINPDYVNNAITQAAKNYSSEYEHIANGYDMDTCKAQLELDGAALGSYCAKYPESVNIYAVKSFKSARDKFDLDKINLLEDDYESGNTYSITDDYDGDNPPF